MALIHCKNCGAKISEYAPKCPKCGAVQIPTETILEDDVISKSNSSNTSKESSSWVKWLIVGVIAGLLIFLSVIYYPKLFQQNNEDDMLLAEWDQELNDNNFNNNNRINGHEYVDLGLPSRTKWATCNVGASQPHEYGNYYAWGEITTKNNYTEDNSKTYGKNIGDISGNPNYDAAAANWGSRWRMPTYTEMKELDDKCTWTWTSENEVNGFKVTGPNGNSIFLPAAGSMGYNTTPEGVGEDCFYLTSTPDVETGNCCAYRIFYCLRVSDGLNGGSREPGYSVRPVVD